MVTGQRAFAAKSQISLIGAIMNAEPAALSTLLPLTPPALERVVTKCLGKHPDERWDSAHDIADELRWIAQVSGPRRTPPPAPPSARRVDHRCGCVCSGCPRDRRRYRLVRCQIGVGAPAGSHAVPHRRPARGTD